MSIVPFNFIEVLNKVFEIEKEYIVSELTRNKPTRNHFMNLIKPANLNKISTIETNGRKTVVLNYDCYKNEYFKNLIIKLIQSFGYCCKIFNNGSDVLIWLCVYNFKHLYDDCSRMFFCDKHIDYTKIT